MGHEPGIDIARHTLSVVGEGHGSTAHDEHISGHIPAGKTFTERGESPLQFGPPQKDIVIAVHAASRSDAAR
jgi:hypothetical protein